MNVESSKALLPVQGGIPPIAAAQQRGIGAFLRNDSARTGIRFLGYGSRASGARYGPSGKIIHIRNLRGGIVDIYI